MNNDIEQPNSDSQKMKSTTGADAKKQDVQKQKEGKQAKSANKKADKAQA